MVPRAELLASSMWTALQKIALMVFAMALKLEVLANLDRIAPLKIVTTAAVLMAEACPDRVAKPVALMWSASLKIVPTASAMALKAEPLANSMRIAAPKAA